MIFNLKYIIIYIIARLENGNDETKYHATLTQAQERIEDAIQSQEYEGDMFIFYVQYYPYNMMKNNTAADQL